MDSNFDFEVRADDLASEVLQQINDKVKALQPELAKARDGLALGGRESQEGLDTLGAQFLNLSKLAKDNVQFIGDMVPPLKMVSSLAGQYAGIALKMGGAGAVAYGAVKGIQAVAGGLSDAADSAYALDVAAKNAGMSVHDFSQLSGAMRLLGADSHAAQGSVEGLYKTFNDALQGRNGNVLAVMSQLNAPISRNADGTADVLKTMESLADIFPKLSPQNQKTVADALGLDSTGLQLLREGARLKELLSKSDRVGLSVDPQTNEELTGLNRQLAELSAAWDGFKQKSEQKLAGFLLSDGSVQDGLSGVQDLLVNGPDNVALMHVLGGLRGNEADQLREGYNDPDLLNSLTTYERTMMGFGVMTDGYRKKYLARHPQNGPAEESLPGSSQRPPDSTPSSRRINANAVSVRNNNPWNLNYAGQRDASPAGRFAAFPTPEAGLLAADRQLQLYASGRAAAARGRPLTSLKDIISVASPQNENNTRKMIADASREMKVSPDQKLNLTDPRMRARVLHAVFEREGNNPWSTDQISNLITSQQNPQINAPLITPQPGGQGQVPAVSAAVKELQDKGFKVEITLVNDKTGERQSYNASAGGRVSTAMNFP